MDLMNQLSAIPGAGPLLPYLAALIAIAAIVAVFVPPPGPASGSAYRAFYAVLQWCAANKGHATNAATPAPPPPPQEPAHA